MREIYDTFPEDHAFHKTPLPKQINFLKNAAYTKMAGTYQPEKAVFKQADLNIQHEIQDKKKPNKKKKSLVDDNVFDQDYTTSEKKKSKKRQKTTTDKK
jgi:hypothetical protein